MSASGPRPTGPNRPIGWVADRQDGVRVEAWRDAHRGLRLFLIRQVAGRQSRAKAERTHRKQHVLHRRVDDEPAERVGEAPSRQATIHTGAS